MAGTDGGDSGLHPLWEKRTFVVPGEGDLHARLMLIGEGPGAQEDATGRPFVGAAGQLLDKMLAAIGLAREQVYIANIVKCRPPQNRGQWIERKGVWIMPTFHPAALLRDESKKRPAWEDFKAVRDKLAELEGSGKTQHD